MTKYVDMPFFRKVGSDIRSVRMWNKLSEVEVAESISVNLATYRKIERGVTKQLTCEQVYKLAKKLNCMTEEIIPEIFE